MISLQEPKIYIDQHCEVHDLLSSVACKDFADFESVDIRADAVYVVGSDTMIRSSDKIRNIVESGLAHIVFSKPVEGATTILGQFARFPTQDLIESGRIIVLAGGPLEKKYRHFYFENFLQRLMNFEENISAQQRTNEIYNKVNKPFKFLMFNGRMRPHRKWMIQSLRDSGDLAQSLYTNLDEKNAPDSDLTYINDDKDLMYDIEPIHYLPTYYEVDMYQAQIAAPYNVTNVKHHLFNNEWGEAYIKPEPYIDTYFSLVTETVFFGSNSFRTEKIWKPIIIGHPWIAVANHGFYRDLHNMGFRSFDNVIDESFDLIDNPQERIERISQVVCDLCASNLTKFMLQCKDTCKYNQQVLLDYQINHVSKFPQQFVDFLRDQIQ